jgi:HlyD family secretion protein
MKNPIRKIVLFILLCTAFLACSRIESNDPIIKKGDFTQSITETGELAAQNARTFVLTRYGRYWYRMKIIGLLEHGTKVQAGDSIIQLDPSEIRKFIIEREADLETQLASLEKITVQNENRRSELESQLKSEQASFDLKKLEMEHSRFESDKNRTIKELEFKQAEINLQKVKNRIELSEVIARNDLKIQKLRVTQVRNELNNAKKVIPELTIRTPIPGIFQIASQRRNNLLIKVGDEIQTGTNMGNVPDLTWMKVTTILNETDYLKVGLGQKVIVRLDAINHIPFEGEISYISKLCRPISANSRQKVFDVEVKILTSDERLKPGMTVSCQYICEKLHDVYFVPLNCLETTNNESFIYLRKGTGTQKIKVLTGASNNTHIVIQGNFEKGQALVPIEQVSKNQKS